MLCHCCAFHLFFLLSTAVVNGGNEDAKRLFDDLVRDYNKLLRPVTNSKETLVVYMKLRLSQIINVHEKEQIMTTSIWMRQEWIDPKLKWSPQDYGGVTALYIPYEMIWVPDIVLYNNGDSNYNITIPTKATIHYNGSIVWEPPAIFKSYCEINVAWFPFDEQSCFLKFGSWTYAFPLIDLQHYRGANVTYEHDNDLAAIDNVSIVQDGIDLNDYYPSVEWDVLAVPAKRHNKYYQSCCPDQGAYVDITYYLRLRRKPLFYTVNLIFPCMGISFLTMLVFYLPSDSGEKITLCISILVALTMFFLMLVDIIPANSNVLPLIGKYCLFTMTMVCVSVVLTVAVLNVHFRKPSTHKMPKWVKFVFLRLLPKYLFMRKPLSEDDDSFRRLSSRSRVKQFQLQEANNLVRHNTMIHTTTSRPISNKNLIRTQSNPTKPQRKVGKNLLQLPNGGEPEKLRFKDLYNTPTVLKAFDNVCFIADVLKRQDKADRIDEDWKYVAMVVDRLFLWVFATVSIFGTLIIMVEAPSLFDHTKPLTADQVFV